MATGRSSRGRARIAIDGSQCTGKTTLYRQLSSTHLNVRYKFIPEASRQIAPKFGVLTSRDWPNLLNDKVKLREFFEAEESWQFQQEENITYFVIDSSFYLIAAYRMFFGIEVDFSLLSLKRYDLILYCPMDCCEPLEDSFRFITGREDVDKKYQEIISRCYSGKLVTLPGGSERMTLALETIELFEKNL